LGEEVGGKGEMGGWGGLATCPRRTSRVTLVDEEPRAVVYILARTCGFYGQTVGGGGGFYTYICMYVCIHSNVYSGYIFFSREFDTFTFQEIWCILMYPISMRMCDIGMYIYIHLECIYTYIWNVWHWNAYVHTFDHCNEFFDIWWRRPIGCLKSQIVFHKRTTDYRALVWKMTNTDKASHASSPPFTFRCIKLCIPMYQISWNVNVSNCLEWTPKILI